MLDERPMQRRPRSKRWRRGATAIRSRCSGRPRSDGWELRALAARGEGCGSAGAVGGDARRASGAYTQRGFSRRNSASGRTIGCCIDWDGGSQETEDPYSFRRCLGSSMSTCLQRAAISNRPRASARSRSTLRRRPRACVSRFGRRTRAASRWLATSTVGTDAGIRCGCGTACGVWEIFIPRLGPGDLYKYELLDADGSAATEGAIRSRGSRAAAGHGFDRRRRRRRLAWSDDGVAARAGRPARRCADLDLRSARGVLAAPRRGTLALVAGAGRPLVPYVRDLGFTHVEFLPIMPHPFGGSWGYQPLGLFAPMRGSGRPAASRGFVDRCHAEGIGVILDWVPAHFPTDAHGLARFDGTALYEHVDPREGPAQRLEHFDLQSRPQRGARLPDRQRSVLARAFPCRRAARRCRRRRCSTATIRGRDRRVDPQPLRRPGKSRGRRFPAGARGWSPQDRCPGR